MNVAIGLMKGVQDQLVADETLVDEDVDATVVGALDFRTRGETGDGKGGFLFFGVKRRFGDGRTKWRGECGDFDQFVERLAAEELIDAVGKFFRGRAVNDGLRGRSEDE